MDAFPAIPYVPGFPPARTEPLARYLPPLAEGVIEAWLKTNLPLRAGEKAPWILDPFAATPRVAIEAARSGYRILVTANNPIARFLLTMYAMPPSESDLRAALANLAAARKGEERLEPHIRSLYSTPCNQCGNEITAEAFLWDRGGWGTSIETSEKTAPVRPTLFGKIIRCPYCAASGEYPALEADLERASQFSFGGLHFARALERVAPLDDPDRHYAEEALATYLPRAVYALFTLINKLDGLFLTARQRDYLTALLLSACDQANTLWPYPTGRARPRLLTIPPRFRENNIWLALEQAVEQWTSTRQPIPITTWPQLPPPDGGICLYIGRLKDLAKELASIPVSAIVTALPRPNQAYWTLSALWAGWLWGREAVAPFKSVLRRRRYDWGWHTTALHAALSSLSGFLHPNALFWGILCEAEPGFLNAALIAADFAGFDLLGLALHEESAQAQITWRYNPGAAAARHLTSKEAQISLARSASREHLQERGQPARYLSLHTAALANLSLQHVCQTLSPHPAEALGQLNELFNEVFTYRHGFLRYGGSEKSLDVGYWWLREMDRVASPLSDRVEVELVHFILNNPGASQHQIDVAMCRAFPGLLTPNASLIQVILTSYAEQRPPNSGFWWIQEQNLPETRQSDIKEISLLLEKIAHSLGYSSEGRAPFLWYDEKGALQYVWHVIASGVIGEIVYRHKHPPAKSLIALPGSRANLVAYKLQHDPRLRQEIEEGWRLIKFRQVRWLAQKPSLSRDEFDDLLTQDALTYDAPQMRLF